jgi:hypothetical protein
MNYAYYQAGNKAHLYKDGEETLCGIKITHHWWMYLEMQENSDICNRCHSIKRLTSENQPKKVDE